MGLSDASLSQHQAVHLSVHGMVQGVGFRYFAHSAADLYGVLGWVRNNYDGTVEIWAEGTPERLEQFMDAIRRGPSHSVVTQLEVDWYAPKGNLHGFTIR